jgi:hypothetical protein
VRTARLGFTAQMMDCLHCPHGGKRKGLRGRQKQLQTASAYALLRITLQQKRRGRRHLVCDVPLHPWRVS